MKHSALLTIFLIAFSTSVMSQPKPQTPPPFRSHFVLKFSGGTNWWKLDEWNDYFGFCNNGPACLQAGPLREPPYNLAGASGELLYGDKLNWGNGGEVEIQYAFNPRYRVAVGVGQAWGTGRFGYESALSVPGWNRELTESRDDRIDVRLTSTKLTFYITDTGYPNRPFLGLGAGYYYSSIVSDLQFSTVSNFKINYDTGELYGAEIDSSIVLDGTLRAGAPGFHAVAGTEYFLNPSISITAEISGRYLKISGYRGEATYTINGGEQITGEVELKTLRDYLSTAYDARVIEIRPSAPGAELTPISSQGFIETGIMDFSGVSFKLGLAYHF